MAEKLRLTVGVMGNAASLLLFAAPILTFSRVIRKRSTEEFSCVPYTIALLNCLLYAWYGLPIVSYKWENFPVATINGLGVLLEISFIIIYLCFATAKRKASCANTLCLVIVLFLIAAKKKMKEFVFTLLSYLCMRPLQLKVAATAISVITIFCITALISATFFHDHHHRKVFVGSVGLVASIAMYGSPLVVVKQVITTKSVEFMPFYLSLFSFVASSLWMAYGLLGHDLVLASPNLVGCPLGILQLVLYCKYRKNGVTEEPEKWDHQKNNNINNNNEDDDKTKQMQPVIDEIHINGKR